ncbi:MAG TPA: alpha/beta hydrolase, partial [Actinotalea sp.]|nr:alpha/beta hydrolase [Actinotalea sp.]
ARGLVPQSVLDRVRQGAGSDDYRAAQGVMRDVFVRVVNEDYREDLVRIAVPVTMVWGELDDSAPVAGARLAAELVPDATLEVVPGAGHLLTGDLEQRVAAALADHLAGAP